MTDRSQTTRRLAWSIVDQAASSLVTLSLTLFVARVASLTTFGAFALTFGGLPLAITTVRAMASDPMAIRHGRGEETAPPSEATGFSVTLGLVIATILLATSVATGGSLRTFLVLLAFALPGALLQDTARASLLILGRPAAAALNNVLRLVAQLVFSGVAIALGDATATSLTVIWGAVTGLAAVVGALQLRMLPRITSGRSWLRRQQELWPSLLGEQFVTTGAWQLALVVLAATSGVAATAGVRGAQTLFGPMTMMHLALPFTMIPILGQKFRSATESTEAVRTMIVLSSFLLVGTFVAIAALLALPPALGEQVLGDSWISTRTVLVGFGLYVAATGINQLPILGLRALGAVRRAVVVSAAAGTLLLIGTAVGAVFAGPSGFVTGLAAATWVISAVWWAVFSNELRATRPSMTMNTDV